jgi:hypothetical protein
MSENGNKSTHKPGKRKLLRQLQTVGALLLTVELVILYSHYLQFPVVSQNIMLGVGTHVNTTRKEKM